MSARAIEAVLFDKDGTLFEFAATWESWAEAFLVRLAGSDDVRAADLGRLVGYDLPTRQFLPNSVVIAGTPAEVAAELLPSLPEWDGPSLIDMLNAEAARAPQVAAVPLAPLLDELRGWGLRLGVVTNDAEAPARAHLGSAAIADRFDFIAGFDSGHGAKPDPGPLLAFAAATGIAPDACLMVGDSTHDLHAARAASMAGLGVLTGYAGTEVLAPLAEAVLPDIGHLPRWLSERDGLVVKAT